MKNFLQIGAGVDVLPLLLELHRQPHLWNRNDVRLSKAGPHWQSDDIWLRYKDETENKKSDYLNFSDPHDGIWYPSYYALPAARKLVFDLMARVEGERIGGIFIYRLAPGKKIFPHVDTGWHVEYYDKFNICLQSNPKAAFVYEDGEAFSQRQGDVHRFINTKPHSVVNEGTDDHIILIVCLRVHDYETRFKGDDGVSEAQRLDKKPGLAEDTCQRDG